MVQPLMLPNFRNEPPAPALPGILRWVQVLPPSAEEATMTGAGDPAPPVWARNSTLQVYTWPKNGEEAALSAQICSLSSKAKVPARWMTMLGRIQLDFCATRGVGSSRRRETATPNSPRTIPWGAGCSTAPKLAARLA